MMMISPEAAKALLGVSLTACVTAFGFTVKGAIEWYEGKTHGEIRFLLGLVGVIAAAAISVVLYSKGFSVAEGSKESEGSGDFGSGSIIENPDEKESRVERKSYEGGVYTGEIDLDTKKPDGSGIMYYSDGNVYDGSWKNGKPDGTGLMTYKNGDTYDGQWKDGKRDGYGTYTWKDNRKYIGYYKNDMRDGRGEFFGWTGFIKEYGWSGDYTGTSKENYFDGEGCFVFENGDQFEGIFLAGQFWNGTYTYSNGAQLQITGGVPST